MANIIFSIYNAFNFVYFLAFFLAWFEEAPDWRKNWCHLKIGAILHIYLIFSLTNWCRVTYSPNFFPDISRIFHHFLPS